MATINLVTGYTGTAHVKSEEDALLNRFLLGQNNAVINLTDTFNANSAVIDCDAIVDGRLMRTDGDVTLEFTTPSSGYYRYDGIYLVYKKLTTGVESAELVYCEGTENVAQAAAQSNIGTPTIGSDVDSYSLLQLFTVAWDNTQQKTVTQNNEIMPEIYNFTVSNPYGDTTRTLTVPARVIPICQGVKLYVVNFEKVSFPLTVDAVNLFDFPSPNSAAFIGGSGIALAYSSSGNASTYYSAYEIGLETAMLAVVVPAGAATPTGVRLTGTFIAINS